MTVERFFEGREASRAVYDVVAAVAGAAGPVDVLVAEGQIALRRAGERRANAFAWAWVPGRWLVADAAPLVLSIALPARDPSPRWRWVWETRRGRIVHHIALAGAGDVDDEVRAWLAAARASTG